MKDSEILSLTICLLVLFICVMTRAVGFEKIVPLIFATIIGSAYLFMLLFIPVLLLMVVGQDIRNRELSIQELSAWTFTLIIYIIVFVGPIWLAISDGPTLRESDRPPARLSPGTQSRINEHFENLPEGLVIYSCPVEPK